MAWMLQVRLAHLLNYGFEIRQMLLKWQSNRLVLPPSCISFGKIPKRSPISVIYLERKTMFWGSRRTSGVASDGSGLELEVGKGRHCIFWVYSCDYNPERNLDCICKFVTFLMHRICCG
ncbi:hypothetical protein CEXT_324141 [Caerostris extrusa]|uniref:Uncharacterized protein n=1 Tax=Caerostris extrusa TaxID=172846 RepID=A0AAV4XNZ4_CAEEX|nr:hypothetical protein CEXT_324141 [Caerostris extrusa]